jgi:DNA-binding MarR family transcriptional regulator
MVSLDPKENIPTNLFLRIKPINLLLEMKDGPKYASMLAKSTDCTYSHVVKLLETFRKLGLVHFERKGRIKVARLTPEGQIIVRNLSSLVMNLKRLKTKG